MSIFIKGALCYVDRTNGQEYRTSSFTNVTFNENTKFYTSDDGTTDIEVKFIVNTEHGPLEGYAHISVDALAGYHYEEEPADINLNSDYIRIVEYPSVVYSSENY